jgi:hypothetical protein
MAMPRERAFFELYQTYRYQDQLNFYTLRQREFSNAQEQGLTISIVLIFLGAAAAALEVAPVAWLKLPCLIIAAILPIVSTALTGYIALYAFEQQAKLYKNTANGLLRLQAQEYLLQQTEDKREFIEQLTSYIEQTEEILQLEHGQWFQIARTMKPPDI